MGSGEDRSLWEETVGKDGRKVKKGDGQCDIPSDVLVVGVAFRCAAPWGECVGEHGRRKRYDAVR